MKYVYSIILMAVWMSLLQGQDARMTQFTHNPAALNPSMTGMYDGQWQLYGRYRDQWNSVLQGQAYRSVAVGWSVRQAVGRSDFWSLGLSMERDLLIGQGRWTRQQIAVSGALQKQLLEHRNGWSHYLMAGAQLGGMQQGFSLDQLWFSEQFDQESGMPDMSNANGEDLPGVNEVRTNVLPDFSAGLSWYMALDDRASMFIGGALYHINEPSLNWFKGSVEQWWMRKSLHAGGEIPLSRYLSILPSFLIQWQDPAVLRSSGLQIRYRLGDWQELAIRAGLWQHHTHALDNGSQTDAWSVGGVLEWERIQVGLSYDINSSPLQIATNHRGAFELNVRYVHPGGKRRSRVSCPNM